MNLIFVTEHDILMTREQWIKHCDAGYLIDYDGFAEYSDGMFKYNEYVSPSERDDFNKRYSHIIWYNR